MAGQLLITAEAIPAKVCRGFAPGIAQKQNLGKHFRDTEMLEVTGCQPIATPICRKCGVI
ncbi:hypothetical protein RJJ65_02700 [Rhizobium hidalgonense]|uniref:Uncharacterized protein n=1 Tax=Rhizobium hidalgonense TaxID=1538159 RepID=A0AAJ2LH27_9HYPH|nr:hypothetical protein [Rhizobium hidalgonense]MDR9771585.1 hypothetical protein [Rhizobium hidalgonense]MDR9808845.1 hypothetical protein [Rhizobium hidalgonense]MDR9822426.1 hypothetical protein [Rhizobium hidalgonense]QKK21842.1 hypothetical protein FFM81_008470 [Rhizobium hidalgonense]